jgi:hypothetical protein
VALYRANDFSLDLPADLKDKTVHIFSLTDDQPSEFSLVIARDSLHDGEDLAGYLTRQRALFTRKLPGFELLQDREVLVDGRPGVEADHAWRAAEGRMHQRQVALVAEDRRGGRPQVLLFTATCKDTISVRWERAFAEMVKTIRLQP